MTRNILCGAVFALLLLSTMGCGDGDGGNSTFNERRVVNAVAGLPANATVNITAGPQSAAGLPFGGATPYTQQAAGLTTVAVTNAQDSSVLLSNLSVAFEASRTQTLAAAGVSAQTGALAPRLFLFTETVPQNKTGEADASKNLAGIRLINLSPNSSAVDAYSGDPAAPILGLTNQTYGNASPYALVPSGTLRLSLRETATGRDLTLPTPARGVNLTPGKSYTILLVGLTTAPAGSPDALDARVVPDN